MSVDDVAYIAEVTVSDWEVEFYVQGPDERILVLFMSRSTSRIRGSELS